MYDFPEQVLQRKEYFGQYGKVTKVSLSRTAGGAIQQFINDTCNVYITYSKEEEALRCIQSVHGSSLEDRLLRASFGTAKYCHARLKNMVPKQPDGFQCGYYVMKYMKDIIDSAVETIDTLQLLFNDKSYCTRDLDHVRMEWEDTVQDYMYT